MKRITDFFIMLFHMCFRHIDFPTKLGLIKIGNPDENSPVLISGNYIYTVRRLIKILNGFDCYLLVAKSSGSNVWCAAGMGEFSEHDVIDIINFTEISDLVKHRNVILAPTAAVGVDVKIVKEKTGFNIKWAPYHYTHLPKYLNNKCKKTKEMYTMPFPLRDRLEMALGTATMTSLTPAIISIFWMRGFFLKLVLMIFTVTLFNFSLYPLFPKEKYFRRTLLSLVIITVGLFTIGFYRNWAMPDYIIWEALLIAVMFVSCSDMCGSTVVVKTTIQHWVTSGNYESLFRPVVNPNLCVGCRKCIDVCPKDVYKVGSDKKIFADKPIECFECLACIKQCEKKAIYNINPGVYKKDIRSIPDLDEMMKRPIDFVYTNKLDKNCEITIKNNKLFKGGTINE